MVCFVVLTNILLLTSLIAILSQSLTKVCDSAAKLVRKASPPFPTGDARALAAMSPILFGFKV